MLPDLLPYVLVDLSHTYNGGLADHVLRAANVRGDIFDVFRKYNVRSVFLN